MESRVDEHNEQKKYTAQLQEYREKHNKILAQHSFKMRLSFLEDVQLFDQALEQFKQNFYAIFAKYYVEKIEELIHSLEALTNEAGTLTKKEILNKELYQIPFNKCKIYLQNLLNNQSLLSEACYTLYVIPLIDELWNCKYQIEKICFPEKYEKSSTQKILGLLSPPATMTKQQLTNLYNEHKSKRPKGKAFYEWMCELQFNGPWQIEHFTKFLEKNTASDYSYENFLYTFLNEEDQQLFNNHYLYSNFQTAQFFQQWKVACNRIYNQKSSLLASLPPEIMLHIMSFLSRPELKTISSTCQQLKKTTDTSAVLHKDYSKLFSAPHIKKTAVGTMALLKDFFICSTDDRTEPSFFAGAFSDANKSYLDHTTYAGHADIYHILTGKLMHSFNTNTEFWPKLDGDGYIRKFAVLPDGIASICATNIEKKIHKIHIWDSQTWKCKHILKLKMHLYDIVALGNGDLASYSSDCYKNITTYHIHIWDIQAEKCKFTFRLNAGAPSFVALHNDSIAVSTSNKTIEIWNTKTGECKKILSEHADDYYSIYALPNGNLVGLTRYGNSSIIYIWEHLNWRCKNKFTINTQLPCPNTSPLPTNKLVTLDSSGVNIWCLQTGKKFGSFMEAYGVPVHRSFNFFPVHAMWLENGDLLLGKHNEISLLKFPQLCPAVEMVANFTMSGQRP